ncbi:translocation/assembly module TamB domain-containing protein [Flavobacterium sp. Fl-77]|uniref:Translocation/assembly module TamB domain-containing protein n=1 Tax=Flavobacterium flavipigmentatum TaxID=2893884 RepID=A0AAJ2SHJ5_9FLAO|nr:MULTISPECIES: translocation/assembly module TamB domain-containing protein [unclassified Flavobacterium]MDX6182662.1 translocation/assembly module TamB domain-containing protein [Flavobacterium sp. Fl-33]MDX6186158.1 translocation/assembly module TamB domain-containing protein [Flavobacterium sp. Fl-77]UFH40584.1 translocation/assembly module TamB [Flavobacterium sp. F-70]
MSLPVVQTYIAHYATRTLNEDFKTDITVDKVAINIFGGVKLKNVLIKDHHKKTLIYSDIISTDILSFKRLTDGDLIFGDIRLTGLIFNLKTYKGENENNINKFIRLFETGKASEKTNKHFLMTAKNAYISRGAFSVVDENKVNKNMLDLKNLNAYISDFKIYGPDVNTYIHRFSFLDSRGLYVSNLKSKFSYTKKQIKLEELAITTKRSSIYGKLEMNYKVEDFLNFTDKVQFKAVFDSASIASNDIRYFYDGLGKSQHFKIRTKIKGTLNNLTLNRLRLSDTNGSKINGNINFRNLLGNKNQKFSMDGKFDKLISSYDNLVAILPNVLGKKLPKELKRIGKFNIVGKAKVSTTDLEADFYMVTDLGNGKANLNMNNIDFIDKASYSGNIVLENFDIGTLLDRKDLGKTTLNLDIDGVGFSEKYLNTVIKGDISKFDYNKYTYNNIVVDGTFKLPYYKGQLSVNDPNLSLTFDGLVDLSKRESKYDFHLNVENADLRKLKFVNDSISYFRGDMVVEATGNSIENLQGNIYLKDAVYQNPKATYEFDEVTVNSSFDTNKLRTITVNSTDIVDGKIVGKFQFNQLGRLVMNSVGSLYTNYKPYKVGKGQFLNFNFHVYNKVVEMLYPEIKIDSSTAFRGRIDSDKKEFKFRFNSQKVTAAENEFNNIRIAIDNKNPLYNAFVELDSIKTKYYKVRDFSLINVTSKDTLFVRSEFKGGDRGEDYYNLNLYHTIDKNKNNIVGIHKSEMKFKDYLWFLNEDSKKDNQIVFDQDFKNFTIDNIVLSHENQKIDLNGVIKGKDYKDIALNFEDVDIYKITPLNNKFVFKGNLNGNINFKQNKDVYQPTASIVVDHLNLNDTELGTLDFDISGDQSFKKFTIYSTIENGFTQSFKADGNFSIENKETILDLNLKLEGFNLATLGKVGGDVLSNIRGSVSGNAAIVGNVKKPEINGRLYLEKAGMTIPYLNTDYALSDRTVVDLTGEKFLFRNNQLTDSKYDTKGLLNGSIEHNNFADWKLDLNISTKRLLVLDTKDSEDAAYFGTAFINGTASITGPVDGLFIKVAAKSEKGTQIKIPINNAESVGESSFIHFVTPKEKYNLANGILENTRNYNGLELEFDFDITPDAEVEVILDRSSGHGMKGKGYGSLLFKINTLGKFNMWGDFQAYEGTYNFKYKGLVDKKFSVKKGGSITWEGNPMRAQLNLEAVYKTLANPAVLLENSSFNKKVPVEVVIGLRGDLASPEPNFDILFPSVSSVFKSEIQYKLDDKDVRQTQALYLLSTGSFMSTDGFNQNDLSGTFAETAMGLLGGIIKSDNDKFNVGLNFISADRRIGQEADGQFVATVSSQINEKISINGKVGVPVGGINESAIVGDIEVLYRINPDGTANLRLFNKENDVSYIGQGIGYTQGVGITYEVDFDTFTELVNKIFKNHKLERASKTSDDYQDSYLNPDFINFNNAKKEKENAAKKDTDKKDDKKKEEQKREDLNQGLIPDDDF